ncbi:UvrB/UvrC motif-containing protein [Isosphaeraceae bacterium EP7]
MSKDISTILSAWEFDPDEMPVRIVAGDDGRDKIQTRVDLGLLQMELDGRPDGGRPEGKESLLDALEARVAEATSSGSVTDFELDAPECAALMREGVQYYQRYLAAFHLERYDLVARDTARNLRLFEFVRRHATRPFDKLQFDQYRPYVTMMHARAKALQALALNDHAEAIGAVDAGIAAIRVFLEEYDQATREADCMELGFLLRWRRELERDRPVGPLQRLEQQLAVAVELEDFEEAALVRDQLRRLRGEGVAPGQPA